jgi:hypothetical protein
LFDAQRATSLSGPGGEVHRPEDPQLPTFRTETYVVRVDACSSHDGHNGKGAESRATLALHADGRQSTRSPNEDGGGGAVPPSARRQFIIDTRKTSKST